MGSAKFKLDLTDLWRVTKNGLLVSAAAGLTYLSQNIGDIDLGTLGVLVVPIIGTGLDTLIQWFKDNTKVDELSK